MKKFIAFALVIFLALLFAACGGNDREQDGAGKSELSKPASDTAILPHIPKPDMKNGSENKANDIRRINMDIEAANAYVLNIDTGEVLYQKNSDEHIAPASTVKMLTALTVLDYCSLDEVITVGSEIGLIAVDSSVAWLNRGDRLTVEQLLAGLLLPSGNDAAYTLAVNVGRKIPGDSGLSTEQASEVFVEAMNMKAKEIGAISSNFTTPDGYDANGQYTTAVDLAQIARVCLNSEVLSRIMGSYRIDEVLIDGQEITYLNTNKLMNPNSPFYYSSAIGLKTGYSGKADYCLVSAASIKGATYVCVVMDGSADGRFSDSLILFGEIDPAISL